MDFDNCKRLANCTNNKEVYLTVLRAHSREGHLQYSQYLQSLEADLADAEQDEGNGGEEGVAAYTIDTGKECEAVSAVGKSNKQSIQVNITHDIIFSFMIS